MWAVAEAESGLAQGRKSELKTEDLRRQGGASTAALCHTRGLCLAQVHAPNVSALLRDQRSLCTQLMTKGTLVSCQGHRGTSEEEFSSKLDSSLRCWTGPITVAPGGSEHLASSGGKRRWFWGPSRCCQAWTLPLWAKFGYLKIFGKCKNCLDEIKPGV